MQGWSLRTEKTAAFCDCRVTNKQTGNTVCCHGQMSFFEPENIYPMLGISSSTTKSDRMKRCLARSNRFVMDSWICGERTTWRCCPGINGINDTRHWCSPSAGIWPPKLDANPSVLGCRLSFHLLIVFHIPEKVFNQIKDRANAFHSDLKYCTFFESWPGTPYLRSHSREQG